MAMNERIQKLVDLATEDILGVKILNKEKFAELIIQESVQFLKDCNSEFEAEQLEEFWNL
jgi:hypothetical protein